MSRAAAVMLAARPAAGLVPAAGPAAALLLAATATAAQAPEPLPPALAVVLQAARADCASIDGGQLTVDDGAISRPDLTGDGAPDWAFDTARLTCSSAASLYCGTGGCGVSFLVGDTLTQTLAKGWQVLAMPPLTAVLLQVHGSLCGGINPTPCLEAWVWDAERGQFSTVRPGP